MDEQDVREGFGRRLREMRKERMLSQEHLGELAGLDRTYVSQVEAGRRNLTLLSIHKLANALGVDPAALVSDDGPATRK